MKTKTYHPAIPILIHPQYNGNISRIDWGKGENEQSTYYFEYDELNRLLSAEYENDFNAAMDFSTSYSYDKNGNILTLNRQGFINGKSNCIDELTYTYSGNTLRAVDDKKDLINQSYGFVDNGSRSRTTSPDAIAIGMSKIDYFYDSNGNLRRDNNKQITDVKYNNLNLPTQIKIYNSQKLNRINYLYDANGTKLVEFAENRIDYVENLIFENRQLKYVLLPQGRIAFYDNSPMPEFFIKDHLGSVRMIVDGYIQIIEENSYYPYGMQIKSLSLSQTNNRHKYNGKELISDYGLDWHDYGARNYDAQVARWWVVDPLAEERFWLSPYNYAQNNPFMRIDPDGRLDDWWITKNGDVVHIANTNEKNHASQLSGVAKWHAQDGQCCGTVFAGQPNKSLKSFSSIAEFSNSLYNPVMKNFYESDIEKTKFTGKMLAGVAISIAAVEAGAIGIASGAIGKFFGGAGADFGAQMSTNKGEFSEWNATQSLGAGVMAATNTKGFACLFGLSATVGVASSGLEITPSGANTVFNGKKARDFLLESSLNTVGNIIGGAGSTGKNTNTIRDAIEQIPSYYLNVTNNTIQDNTKYELNK